MKKLFNKSLKDERRDERKIEKVYVVDIKCYDISESLMGTFLTNDISVYRTKQDAKDAIERKIKHYKKCCSYTNVNVDDRFEDAKFITYSYSDMPSEHRRRIIYMTEQDLK